MPGLLKVPAAKKIDVDETGKIFVLFLGNILIYKYFKIIFELESFGACCLIIKIV
jgi:hypothetical protein